MSKTNPVWTIKSMLEWATDYFKEKDIPDPRLSIEWLLSEILAIPRLDLYLQFDRPLSSQELDDLRPLIKRRALHEPLQYIVGYTKFMNAHIAVTPDVLIPRTETEQLVEIILDSIPRDTEQSVLDVGTGSACIPIALKLERPHWKMNAIDISAEALTLAADNATQNNVDISFHQGDINNWDKLPFQEGFDLIVSNPPYVTPDEKNMLEPQVAEHEPELALFSEHMEELYLNIIEFADAKLLGKGQLFLEIHEHRSNMILSLFDHSRWHPTLRKDYEGKPRFIVANKENPA
jgi:release factor glutamine methyltransferase